MTTPSVVSHRSTTTRRTPPEHHRAATEVPRNSGHPRPDRVQLRRPLGPRPIGTRECHRGGGVHLAQVFRDKEPVEAAEANKALERVIGAIPRLASSRKKARTWRRYMRVFGAND